MKVIAQLELLCFSLRLPLLQAILKSVLVG